MKKTDRTDYVGIIAGLGMCILYIVQITCVIVGYTAPIRDLSFLYTVANIVFWCKVIDSNANYAISKFWGGFLVTEAFLIIPFGISKLYNLIASL